MLILQQVRVSWCSHPPYPQSRGERPETAYRTCAANQLSTVCRLGVNRDSTREHLDPQRTSPQVKANDIQVTVGHSVSALSTSSLKVADLYICNEANIDPAHCTVLHTLNQCVAFPGPFAYQTKVITQAKGSLCKYYTKPSCMDGDLYFSYVSNPTQDAQLSGWGVEKLAGVWCGGTGATSTANVSAVNTRTSIGSSPVVPSNLSKRGNPFYHWSTSPGSTSICRQPDLSTIKPSKLGTPAWLDCWVPLLQLSLIGLVG